MKINSISVVIWAAAAAVVCVVDESIHRNWLPSLRVTAGLAAFCCPDYINIYIKELLFALETQVRRRLCLHSCSVLVLTCYIYISFHFCGYLNAPCFYRIILILYWVRWINSLLPCFTKIRGIWLKTANVSSVVLYFNLSQSPRACHKLRSPHNALVNDHDLLIERRACVVYYQPL